MQSYFPQMLHLPDELFHRELRSIGRLSGKMSEKFHLEKFHEINI
jgi:hypothetical protein